MRKSRFLMILMLLGLVATLGALSARQAARASEPAEIQEVALSSIPDWTYDVLDELLDPGAEPEQGTDLGGATSAAGDVNGDGIVDVIIGADKYTYTAYRGGAALLFWGSYGGPSTHYDWIAGGEKGSRFGGAVSGVGNVNGLNTDGKAYDDIIVGAWSYKAGDLLPETGAAYVYYGGWGGPGSDADWQYNSDQKEAWFGWSVGAAGDVNGDTFSDIIVGAPLEEDMTVMTPTLSEGRVYVFYGSENGLPDQPSWSAYGGSIGARWGWSVSGAGDVNGDGYADIIAGAPGYAGIGRAVVYHGGDEGEDEGLAQTPAWTTQGSQKNSLFGYAVAGAGDVNGDGFDDVIVAAPGITTTLGTTEVKGAAYVYLGSKEGLATQPVATLYSSRLTGLYGYRVAGGGDVNNDGYDDVLVSAPKFTADQPEEGAIFLYYGSLTGTSRFAGWSAYGDKAYAELGWGVDIAGDVNADDFADIISGAPIYKLDDKDPVGRAMVYFGDDSGNPGGISIFLPLVVR